MKKLKIIAIISIVIVIVSFIAYSDYKWANKTISFYKTEGYEVAATSNNFIDPVHPWTIFKQPITRIAFYKPDSVVQIDDKHIIADILWVDHKTLSNMKPETFRDIFDCSSRRSAYLDEEANITNIDFEQLKWNQFEEGMPGYQVNKTICKLKK